MKKALLIWIVALAVLFIFPITASASSGIVVVSKTGDGTWSGNAWQVQMFPGETKTTTITLFNPSGDSCLVESAISPSPQDNGNLVFGVSEPSFILMGGYFAEIYLVAEASGSTTPGLYTAEFVIAYETVVAYSPTVSSLKIYRLSAVNITEDSADIVWQTNRGARSELSCWASPKFTVEDNGYRTEHSMRLDGLADNTAYRFEVLCFDRYGNIRSVEGRFTTLKTETVEPIEPTPPPTEPEPESIEPETVPPEVSPPTTPAPPETETVETAENIPWTMIFGIVVVGALAVVGLAYWVGYKKAKKARKAK